jgi:hypothetical protein
MYINFDAVEESIESNEKTWKIKTVNSDRQPNSCVALPKDFISNRLTLQTVKDAVAHVIAQNVSDYLSDKKEDLTRDEVKEKLKNKISGFLNANSERIKGVEKDFAKRKLAFGADLEGFIHTIKWRLINTNVLPTGVQDLNSKKWAELDGKIQTTYYSAWIRQRDIADQANALITPESLIKNLP